MIRKRGIARLQCQYCTWRSLGGLRAPICAFHWALGCWGLRWASFCFPGHPQAVTDA